VLKQTGTYCCLEARRASATVAAQVGQRLGVAWSQVHDLRLALQRTCVQIPHSSPVGTFDAPDGLLTVGESLTPAIEVVMERHVDQRSRIVIEGDAVLPSLFERAAVHERATKGCIRAVFLYELDEGALYAGHRIRGRGFTDRAHVRKNVLFGQWLKQEADQRALPTVPARPWTTLADRILAASGLSHHAPPVSP
jgi:hypothetical protein